MLCVDWEDRDSLPKKPGIYYIYVGTEIVYIGQSKSLHRRWNATGKYLHHHFWDCQKINSRHGKVRLAFLLVHSRNLDVIERSEIQKHLPSWNKVTYSSCQSG